MLMLCCLTAAAQTTDYGTEWEASATLKVWKGGELTLGEELRLKDNTQRYAKSETSASLQHTILRKQMKPYGIRWRIGGGYSFINRQNSEYIFYNQHRTMLQTSLAKDWGPWRLSGRLRYQQSWRNPATGSYQVNPQQVLRMRLAARYKASGAPLQLTLSEEIFCQIANPKGNWVDECRTQLAVTHELNKHHSISIYGKIAQELQTANPERFIAIGISYDIQ